MKKTYQFTLIAILVLSMNVPLFADSLVPYFPESSVKNDISGIGTAVTDLTALKIPEGNFTLEMQGTSSVKITLCQNGKGYEYTPSATGTVRFVCYNKILYVYENGKFKGKLTYAAFSSNFPEITDENAASSESQLLKNNSFETVDNGLVSGSTSRCYIGTPWTTNVTFTSTGIRVDSSSVKCKNGKYYLCWRGKGNAYISQPLSGIKASTPYKITVRQVDGANGSTPYYVGLGSTVNGMEYGKGQVTLGAVTNAQYSAEFITPDSVSEQSYFTFSSNGTETGTGVTSSLVTQIDYISLVEGTRTVFDGLQGATNAIIINDAAYVPSSEAGSSYDMTSYAIANSNFELGTSTLLFSNKGADIYAPTDWALPAYSADANGWDNTAIDKSTVHGGTYSFRMRFRWGASRSMTLMQKLVELPQGKYTLSAFVNASNANDIKKACIVVKDTADNELARSTESLTANAWTQLNASFFLATKTPVVVYATATGSNPQSYESLFYFDDFQLVSSSISQYLTDEIAKGKLLLNDTLIYESSLHSQLSSLITAGETAQSSSDYQTIMNAVTPLDSIITVVNNNIDSYKQLKEYLAYLKMAIDNYKRSDITPYYTEVEGKYSSANISSEEITAEIAKKDSVLYTVNLEPVNKDLYDIVQTIDIDSVESSFYVNYSQTFAGDYHYVAYYDKDKNFCVAYRKLTDTSFKKTTLNSKVGWDTHNYTTLIVDDQGYIHVSGNMHNCTHVNYWRSVRPYDASEFTYYSNLVGTNESSVTYPHFMKTNDGKLLYHYRDGSSGSGSEIYDIWNPSTMTWSRFLDKPMVDGEGLRNAYMSGPTYINGYYHLYWVWRSTADCSTNHDFSYARSKDLLSWESAQGEAVASPITFAETKLKVDAPALKQGNGMLNGVQRLGFDSKGAVILCNMKYDSLGNTQFYAYKLDAENKWKEVCLTNWIYRFEFSGVGSINYGAWMGSLRNVGDGTMGLQCGNKKYGSYEIIFDENTLQPIKSCEIAPTHPLSLDSVTIKGTYSLPIGTRIIKTGDYLLRWETMAANNDAKPSGTLPPNIVLKCIQIKAKSVTPVGIKAVGDKSDFSVKQKSGTIEISGLKTASPLFLYNADGKLMQQVNVTSSTCRMNKPVSGVYVIRQNDKTCKMLVK